VASFIPVQSHVQSHFQTLRQFQRQFQRNFQNVLNCFQGNSKLAKLLIRQAFAQRRKKIRNTLSRAPKRIARVSGWHAKAYRDAMQSIDCDFFDERPEDLDLEDWLELARLLEDARAAMG